MRRDPPPPSRKPPAAPAPGGLRERKKRKTREAIQRAALRLFQRQGYEDTTVEQIAEAVEISPSTFFNYFPSKEDVVFTDDYDPLFVSSFPPPPAGEWPSATLRVLIGDVARFYEEEGDLILARSKLALQVPELRARIWDHTEEEVRRFCSVLARWTGRSADDFELRVTGWAVISALFAANEEWVRQDGRANLAELYRRALDTIEAGARLDALVAGTRR